MTEACSYCGGHAVMGGVECPECDGSGMELDWGDDSLGSYSAVQEILTHQTEAYSVRPAQREITARCHGINKDTSIACDSIESVTVDAYLHDRWRRGLTENIQIVFADLDDSQREILLGDRSGFFICNACWSVLFKGD